MSNFLFTSIVPIFMINIFAVNGILKFCINNNKNMRHFQIPKSKRYMKTYINQKNLKISKIILLNYYFSPSLLNYLDFSLSVALCIYYFSSFLFIKSIMLTNNFASSNQLFFIHFIA